jgi:diadenosine tetraphosphate (Ap4A) HIT family hydrolase
MANDHSLAFYDDFPVTPGHSLIVPSRHITSFFEATREEQAALFDLVAEMRQRLMTERNPDGFNIGINDGAAAGQTVMHLHIHLIPRYAGDTEDPRGGVRWIMPVKATLGKRGHGKRVRSGVSRSGVRHAIMQLAAGFCLFDPSLGFPSVPVPQSVWLLSSKMMGHAQLPLQVERLYNLSSPR